MRISEPFKTFSGYAARALPLKKWRRPDGLSSFLADMIALRKTLNLCASCEHKMPHRWLDRTNYTLVRNFHAEACACDRCRQDAPTNMYVACEGRYAQQLEEERRSMSEMRARERARINADSRYLLEQGANGVPLGFGMINRH